MKHIIKQLLILFVVNLVAALLIKGVTTAAGIKNNKMSFDHAVWVFRDEIGNDSWKPMKLAYDHWVESGRKSLIYTDLLLPVRVKFLYPPTALLITQWIENNEINLQVFSRWTTILSLLAMAGSTAAVALWLYGRGQGDALSGVEQAGVGVLVGFLMFTFYPVVKAGTLGQLQVWLNAFFAVAILAYLRGWELVAGVMLGLMASIKPHYALFALWGLLRGNRKMVAAILVTGGVGVLLGIREFGFAMFVDYLRALSFVSQHGESVFTNQSFNALAGRLLSVRYPEAFNNLRWSAYRYPPYNTWVFMFSQASAIVILALTLVKSKRVNEESRLADFLLMGLGATMASPIAWEHHYGILFPIFVSVGMLLWHAENPVRHGWVKVGLLLCYITAANVIPFTKFLANSYLNILQSYLLLAASGLLVVLVWLKFGRKTIEATLGPGR